MGESEREGRVGRDVRAQRNHSRIGQSEPDVQRPHSVHNPIFAEWPLLPKCLHLLVLSARTPRPSAFPLFPALLAPSGPSRTYENILAGSGMRGRAKGYAMAQHKCISGETAHWVVPGRFVLIGQGMSS